MRAAGAYYDGRDVVAWTRGPDGQREWQRARAVHGCWIDDKAAGNEKLARFIRATSAITGVDKASDGWTRLRFRDADVLFRACAPSVWHRGEKSPGLLKQFDVPTCEADLDPVRRWLLEERVQIQKPRRSFLDIETDSRVGIDRMGAGRILCWTAKLPGGDYVTESLAEESDEAERELLTLLFSELEAADQIASWNGDWFDFPVLQARLERLRLRVDLRNWLLVDHLLVFERMNKSASKSGDEKQSMALDSIAHAIIGAGKSDFDASRTYDAWLNDRAALERYNARDVWLMARIEEETGYLDIHDTVCEACGVFADTLGANPGTFVDQFILRLARERGLRLPTKYGGRRRNEEEGDDGSKYEGAFVLEPTERGILKGVHVADFASMYPSIIRSWNMSSETRSDFVLADDAPPAYLRHLPRTKRERPPGTCETPNGTVFLLEPEGILSIALGVLVELRRRANDEKKKHPPGSPEWLRLDRLTMAYKITANSFYGVEGSPMFRLHDREVAEAITQTGVWMLKQVLRNGEERSIRGLYGDTDAIFARGVADEAFREFVRFCNEEFFPAELKRMGAPRNFLKLEYEKKFERIILVGKKRYAGRYEHYKGQPADDTSEPEVKGLEYKRGDASQLARAMQAEVLDLLVGGGILEKGIRRANCCEDPDVFEKLVVRWRAHILHGQLRPELFCVSKSLQKPLREYAVRIKKDGTQAAQPPHVEIAKRLVAKKVPVYSGMRITYYVRNGQTSPMEVSHIDDYADDVDRWHLWEDQVWPPTERVLEAAFPERPWSSYGADYRKQIGAGLKAFGKFVLGKKAKVRLHRGKVPDGQGNLF